MRYDFVLVRRGTSYEPQLSITTPPDGGVFVWDEAGTENDNQGTIIVPNNPLPENKGRWKRLYSGRINVKWFNAKGDGITDDLAALTLASYAASQLNADIEFPTGKYLVSGTWELTGSRCNLIGIGDATIQALNPQELATLSEPIIVEVRPPPEDPILPKTIIVSSTDKFSIGQKIKIVGLDIGNHVIGASEVYTIESINVGTRALNLTTGVKRNYERFDPVTQKGTLILAISSVSAVIQISESVVDANIENMHFEGIGPLRFGVQRSGISFKGKRSLRCLNVESYNHSQNGVIIYAAARNENDKTLGDRHFHFDNCNMHDNGYAGIYGAPFFTITNAGKTETVTGSVQVSGGIYSNNGPEWSGFSAYGMTLNGSKTVVTGAKCENNTGPQIDHHSQNKSTLICTGLHTGMGAK